VGYLAFLILGLGNGAAFAALALALVMTYRSSGVVNFGAGAVALYTAYTYSYLRHGDLLVPIPGLPPTVHLAGALSKGVALAVSLVAGGLLNALLYLIVFRWLRSAPAVAKAVASIGVLLTIQGLLAQRVGTNPVSVGPIFPANYIQIGATRIPAAVIWFAGTILAVAAVLATLFQRTQFGLATRAVCETEKGAVLTGLSPGRVAIANWALSGAVAGLGGILIAPLIPLVPDAYTLLVVPALAAALAAGFNSLSGTVAVALTMGMLQSLLGLLQAQHRWLPQQGPAEIVTFLAILVFLLMKGRGLPSRGAIALRTLGDAPRPRYPLPWIVFGGGAVAIALCATGSAARTAIILSIIYSILALSLVVVTGFAGQVSFAQLGLAGVAAFTLSRLETALRIPFPWSPLIAACVATIVGILIGFPALRLRGLPVAVLTLAIAVVLDAAWFNNPNYTGGSAGATVAKPRLFGIDLSVGSGLAFPRLPFGLLCLTVLLVVASAVAWLRRSRFGAAMLAVRANERSAAASGVNVVGTKLLAFGIGAFIAGLAGSLLSYEATFATPATFSTLTGLGFFAIVYLSGITSIAGGVQAGVFAVGGITYTIFNNLVAVGGWYTVLSGIGLINVAITQPEGCIEPFHVLGDKLVRLWHLKVVRRRLLGRAVAEPPPIAGLAEHRSPAWREVSLESPPVLRIEDVSVTFGGVCALNRVTVDVTEGALVGLIGPNGAGKTTLLDVISGFTSGSGKVVLGEAELTGVSAYRRARDGIGRSFQGIDLYEDLTALENIVVGSEAARGRHGNAARGLWRRRRQDAAYLGELCDVLELTDIKDRRARELSTGQRQLVSIARALAGRPRIVLLDEPAAGLDPEESRWLGQRLTSLRGRGMTTVLIDHDMDLVLSVCDVVYVLDLGEVIACGTPDEIRTNPRVGEAYLGSTEEDPAPAGLAS
jgi:ABC-type branched-subunit amino acid transport system ATPase component/ABC-type branched-subunit amino acid transport system permease subunit